MLCVVLGILEDEQASETHFYMIETDRKEVHNVLSPIGKEPVCV